MLISVQFYLSNTTAYLFPHNPNFGGYMLIEINCHPPPPTTTANTTLNKGGHDLNIIKGNGNLRVMWLTIRKKKEIELLSSSYSHTKAMVLYFFPCIFHASFNMHAS